MKKGFLFSASLTVLLALITTNALSQELEKVKCKENWLWGFVDKSSREIVIFCQYDEVKDFSEGLAAVRRYGDWGFIDKTDKCISTFKYQRAESFSEGLAAVRLNRKWGFIDNKGNEIIPYKYQQTGDFSEGLAAVRLNGKWGFIDKAGKEVVPIKYKDVGFFSGNYALVQYDKFWGIVEKNGTEIVPCIYSDTQSAKAAIAREELKREKMAAQEQERVTQEGINPITTNAYDIILLYSGDEIKAKVLETTDQQIKYKEFDFQSGPIRNINKSEVFRITYENGRTEVFNKHKGTTASPSNRQSLTNCAKNTAFGLDIGIGGANKKFASVLGIRVMHHFSPYFGIDFFKINWITDVYTSSIYTPWAMKIQIMPGIRGNTPTFFKCMSVYSVFRLGYGMQVGDPIFGRLLTDFEGLCLETELGLNLSRTVFIGFAYNYHQFFGNLLGYADHSFSLRLGFNFGR